MFCRYCGKLVPDDSMYCRFCGKKLDDYISEEIGKTIEAPPRCVVCGKILDDELRIPLETGGEMCEECYFAFQENDHDDIENEPKNNPNIDEDILEILNNREDYTLEKLKHTLLWLKENGYDNEFSNLQLYIKKRESEEINNQPSQRYNNISTLKIIGIIIAILGIIATIFCFIQINNDMTPLSYWGITADYKPPFSDYEVQQLTYLFLSIICSIIGIVMWVLGGTKRT